MSLTIGIGQPAYSAANALVIPTNINLILRGNHGQYILDRLGKTFQAEMYKLAPNPAYGDIITIPAIGTDYDAVYAVVAFPYATQSVTWSQIETWLTAGIKQAVSDGHTLVAVPMWEDGGEYNDAPYLFDLNQSLYIKGKYQQAVTTMMNVAYAIQTLDLPYMPVNPFEEIMMNNAYRSVFG